MNNPNGNSMVDKFKLARAWTIALCRAKARGKVNASMARNFSRWVAPLPDVSPSESPGWLKQAAASGREHARRFP